MKTTGLVLAIALLFPGIIPGQDAREYTTNSTEKELANQESVWPAVDPLLGELVQALETVHTLLGAE
jgi:hypothetical protein